MSVRERAARDVEQGDLASARNRLRSSVTTKGHDAAICEEVARLSVRMGDPLTAGLWYFLSDSRDRDAANLISRFVAHNQHNRERVLCALPRCWTQNSSLALPAYVHARIERLEKQSVEQSNPKRHRADMGTFFGCVITLAIVVAVIAIGLLAIYGAVELLARKP
jgi:hypothetical protein